MLKMASRKNEVDTAKLPRASSPYIIRPNSATPIFSPNKKFSGSRRRKDQKVKVSGKKSGKKGERNEAATKGKAADSQGSVDSRSDVTSSNSGCNSHRSSYTDDTWSRDSRSEARQKRWERKEVRTLCKTVENKLTYLVNDGQRENNFSPLGVQVTTYKMMPYDVQYKILEAEMDKAERRKNKQNGERNGKSRLITPTLNRQSEPLVLHTQVARITDYANEVFEAIPVPNLALIHRYRPHSPDVIRSPEHGDVHNYNCHVGAALHTKDYVDFYLREGLQTGNREKSARLQRLRQKKKDEERQTKEKRRNEAKKSSADERQRTKSGQQKENKTSSRMYRETSFTNSVEGEEDRESGRNSAMSRYSNRDSYSSRTSTPSRRSTSASQSQNPDRQPENTDNDDSRSQSTDGRSENGYSNDSRSQKDDSGSQNDDSRSEKANSEDNYSSNFDAEETSSTKGRDSDSVSIHTYVSLEHAARTGGDKDLLSDNEDHRK